MTRDLSDRKHPFQFVTEEMRQACGLFALTVLKEETLTQTNLLEKIETLIPKQMGWLPRPHFAPYYHNKSDFTIQQ
jgi:hypothetical protein